MTKKIAVSLAVILLLSITLSAFPIVGQAAEPTREELDSIFTSVGYTAMYIDTFFAPGATVPDEFIYHYLLLGGRLAEYYHEETGLYQLSYADYITKADAYFSNHSDMMAFLTDPSRTYFDPADETEKSIYDPDTQTITMSEVGGAGGMFSWKLTNVYATADAYILQGMFVDGEVEIPEDARPGFDYILDANGQKMRIGNCLQLTLENVGDTLRISGYEKIDYYYSPEDNFLYAGENGTLTTRYRTITTDSISGTLTLLNEPVSFPQDTTAWYPDGELELSFTASAPEGGEILSVTVTDDAGQHSLELTEDGNYTFTCGNGHVTIRLITDADQIPDDPDSSTGSSTDPSTESTESSTETTEPSTEATEPSTEVTEPSAPPVEPPPTEPTLTPPSYPSQLPTDPTQRPTEPPATEPPATEPPAPSVPEAASGAIQDPATDVVISFPREYADMFQDLTLSVVLPNLETEEQVAAALLNVLQNDPALKVFDISLLDADGSVADLGIPMQVMLPIPESWGSQDLQIFHVDVQTGKVTKLNSAVTEDGKWACFTTDHFSYYVLAQGAQIRSNDIDPIVFIAAGLLAASAVALVAIVIMNLKSKKKAKKK